MHINELTALVTDSRLPADKRLWLSIVVRRMRIENAFDTNELPAVFSKSVALIAQGTEASDKETMDAVCEEFNQMNLNAGDITKPL